MIFMRQIHLFTTNNTHYIHITVQVESYSTTLLYDSLVVAERQRLECGVQIAAVVVVVVVGLLDN